MDQHHRYRPVWFFLTTTILTWIPWFIGVYLGSGSEAEGAVSLFNLLGLLAPMGVTLFVILTSGSQALKGDFRDRLIGVGRIRPAYLLAVLATAPIVMAVSIGISIWFGQSSDQFQWSGSGNLGAMIVLAMVLAPIIEETGWRGYGVDSLRAKMGTLRATLLFGVLWGLWHAPLVLVPGTYQRELATMDNPLYLVNFFVSVIPAAVVANWSYYRNNRSILAGVLLHSVFNAAAVLPNAGQVAKCIATVLYTGIAVGLVVVDREVFKGGPRDFVSDVANR